MSESLEPDHLDVILRQAMQARPDLPMATDLASDAISRAASHEALTKLARVRRWNRALTAFAAVLIVALAAWILCARLSAGGFQEWSDASATTTTSAVNGSGAPTVSDNSTIPMQWMFLGAAMAVGAVVVVVTQRALSGTDAWVTPWAAGDLSHSIHM